MSGTVLQRSSFFKAENEFSEQECALSPTCQVHLKCNKDKMGF